VGEKEGFSVSLMRQIASSPVSGRVTAGWRGRGRGGEMERDIRAKLTRGRSSNRVESERGEEDSQPTSSNDSGGLKSGWERSA